MSEEPTKKRYKVLMSAYACEPHKGSEPGVGWNVAKGMATHHDIWALTRANNRRVIEEELNREPVEGLHFLYYDLPRWASWWKRGGRGVQLYYYLWQLGALRVARRAHRELTFDIGHHVTFVKYWAPSFLAWMQIPYLWGPVGGGESAPDAFYRDFSCKGQVHEILRNIGRWLAGYDPFVRQTVRRCSMALATTQETKSRILRFGLKKCEVLSQVALSEEDVSSLSFQQLKDNPMRFISIGNLIHLKGFHLGLRAFAKAGMPDAEYWFVGDGPERPRLEKIASDLGVADRVKFLGKLTRAEVLANLHECSVLVHPTLHDSGGFVCLEAMAAGKPVICLKLGGPAELVSSATGIVVDAYSPDQTVHDISTAMRRLGEDLDVLRSCGQMGRQRVVQHFLWHHKCQRFDRYYRQVQAMNNGCAIGNAKRLGDISVRNLDCESKTVAREHPSPLLRCSSWMRQQGYDFVVVGDIRGLPTHIPGDVDIVMSRVDLRRFRSEIFEMSKQCGLRVVQCFQHESCALFFVLTSLWDISEAYLRLDVCSDYLRNARHMMCASELLRESRIDDLNSPSSGLPVPNDAAAFKYYLIKKAEKGLLNRVSYSYLRLIWQRLSEADRDIALYSWLDTSTASRVVYAFESDLPDELYGLLHLLASELRLRNCMRLGHLFRDVYRRMFRVLNPTGLIVAFLGPDGSGKTAVLERLETKLLPAFRKVHRDHFRPNFGRIGSGGATGKVVAAPHGQIPRGVAASLLKLSYYTADYLIGMARLYFRCKVRSTLVLFDRYAHDLEADPERYRYGGPHWGARLLGSIVPEPDVVLVLSGDPEVIWKRKREVPYDETARLCEAYENLARRRGWCVLDASAPLDDVVACAEREILSYLERRLYRRFGPA